jgi:hypothetical protein
MSEQTTVARPQASEVLELHIRRFEELDNQVNTLTEQLKALKLQRKELSEIDITNIATEEDVLHCGVTLSDGTEYRFERDYHCGIDKKDQPIAFAWLAERNLSHLVKNYITLEFPADSVEMAQKMRAVIGQLLPQYEVKIVAGDAPANLLVALEELLAKGDMKFKIKQEQGIAGATLAAFVKKCITAGITLPMEFGAYTPLRAIRIPKPAPAPESDVGNIPAAPGHVLGFPVKEGAADQAATS